MTKRHHQVHPPSSVSPNLLVNKKPNAIPQANSSGPTEISASAKTTKAVAREDLNDLDCPDLDLDAD